MRDYACVCFSAVSTIFILSVPPVLVTTPNPGPTIVLATISLVNIPPVLMTTPQPGDYHPVQVPTPQPGDYQPVQVSTPQPGPTMVSTSSNITRVEGESLKVKCRVDNLGSHPIVWRRGVDVLATGSITVTADKRIQVVEKLNTNILMIQDLSVSDAGEYVCQVSTTRGLLAISRILTILVGPRILVDPLNGIVVANEGYTAVLNCTPRGNPMPKITFFKRDSKSGVASLPPGHFSCPDRSCYTIPNVQREFAGKYICRAKNDVGVARATLTLKVLYGPDISLTSGSVSVGVGQSVTLACAVDGQPPPSVHWWNGHRKLVTEESLSTSGSVHIHRLENIRKTDFGNYSCDAENKLGRAKKFLELHGRPSDITFDTNPRTEESHSYELRWSVSSAAPIQEYRLLYRKLNKIGGYYRLQGETEWKHVTIKGQNYSSNYNKKVMSWRLYHLSPSTLYECLVQARNEYGWSQPSKMFSFQTLHNIEQELPKTFNKPGYVGFSSTSLQLFSSELNVIVYICILLNTCFQ